ncbi:MAG: efflux transporter outer membrane subunit [Massilia sp.]
MPNRVHPLPLTRLAGAALALALAGCVHVPADTSHAAGPDFARAQHPSAIKLPRDAWPNEQWWLEYNDPQLNQLVAKALQDSPTLAAAQARVATARAAVRAEQASSGAQVGLNASLNRQRYSSNGLFPEPIGGAWFDDSTVQLKASYDFDWWGKHRAQVAAALGEANARQAEASQAAQTLAAAVAQGYFRLQMLWARQDNTAALAAVQRELVADRAARVKHGLATIDEQRSAELELGSLDEQAERFATQAAREREALRALVGAGSEGLSDLARRAPAAAVAALPQQLGIELLARRPDLQAARWRVEASLGRVKASEAAFYPDLNLVGAIGLNSVSLGKLLRYGSRTMLAGAALELPLFDSGRLEAGLGVARAERDEIIADYNQSVVNAVRDVAEEGATLQGIARQQRAQALATQSGSQLAANAEARFKRGLAGRGALLQAKLTVLRQQDVDLQLADAQLQTQVALVKALGGGYRAAAVQTAAVQASSQHQ